MDIKEFLIKHIGLKIHKVSALLSGFLLIILTAAGLDDFLSKAIVDYKIRFSSYAIIAICWFIYWLVYRFKMPYNKPNKVGLVIGIYVETENEKIKLKSDFISKLEDCIHSEGFGDLIRIITVKNHFTKKLKSANDVRSLHKKIRGHFYLWGDIKKRLDGDKKYFLKLEGLVAHTPTDINIQNDLKREFIKILPKQIDFLEIYEFKGFKFSAEYIYIVVKYITGIAALISGDPFLALKFHKNLKNEFQKFKPLPPNLLQVNNKIPLLISEEYLGIAKWHFYLKKDEAKSKDSLAEALKINPKNYGGLLFKAIIEFYSNDIQGAFHALKKARECANQQFHWRYSEAFLYFWTERYNKALKLSKKIISQSYRFEDITVEEVIAFSLEELKKDPKKIQLYFWIGLLSYKKKHNLGDALDYLEKFYKKADKSQVKLKSRTETYIGEIKKKMGLR